MGLPDLSVSQRDTYKAWLVEGLDFSLSSPLNSGNKTLKKI